MATTTIYWGITDNTLYLSSTATTEASTNFAADNIDNVWEYWPWHNSASTFTSVVTQNQINFNATNLSHMFFNCTKLISADLSNFNTLNVTDMNHMFGYCNALTSLNLSNFNTLNVTSMNSMFNACANLTSLNLSSFNTSKVTDISLMFSNCNALKTIYVSDFWNISNVTSSNNMFYACEVLKGGNGTTYNSNYVDATYAIVDGTNNQPGYLTLGSKLIYINGYHCIKPTYSLRTDSARLYIDTNKTGESSTVNETEEKWLPPETAMLEPLQNSDNNILHLKGIHSFRAKTPRDPWVINRIKKGYITDNGTNILTTNSDGYWTYTPSFGISIGV